MSWFEDLAKSFAKDAARDLVMDALPRVPEPIQEVIDDVRDGNDNVRLIRHKLSRDGVRELQSSYAGGVRKIRKAEQVVKIYRAARRRRDD